MAIVFVDSFSHYNTPQITRKWTTLNETTFNFFEGIIVPTYGRCGQDALVVIEASDNTVGTGPVYTLPTASSSFALGVAIWCWQGVQGNGRGVFRLNSGGVGGANRQLEVVINTDLTISVGTGTGGGTTPLTTTYGTTGKVINANGWHYLELVGTISATVGTVQLWVDNVRVLNLTGLNTDPVGSGQWTNLQLGAVYGTAQGQLGLPVPAGTLLFTGVAVTNSNQITQGIMFSDFYLGTATADRKGDSRVYARLPSGDGARIEWTPLTAGAHYLMVREQRPDDDTTYNAAITTGLVDLYTFPAVAIPSGTISAVQVLPCLRKDVPGAGLAGVATQLGGVDYAGPAQGIADASYLYYPQVFDTNDPAGNPWTVATANALQAGVKVLT